MKRQELICDNCGKTASGDEHHYNLPEGWFILGYHCRPYLAVDDWRVLGHFCSWDCMTLRINASGKEARAVQGG